MSQDIYITINGKKVTVFGEHIQEVVNTKMFKDWISRIDDQIDVKSIEIQAVDFVRDRPIFVKMVVTAFDQLGNQLPGSVFLRGGSVAILMILNCADKKYTILTKQARLAIGQVDFKEIPAGMIDENGDFAGVAAREVAEEVGVRINKKDPVDMTEVIYGKSCPGVPMSPGACDEFMRFFVYEINIDKKSLEELQGKLTGAKNEGERIVLEVIEFDYLAQATTDAKALCACVLYGQLT